MTLSKTVRPALLVLALLPFAGCGTQSVLQQSKRYAELGEWRRSFLVLADEREARLADGTPIDEELEAAYQRMRLKYLLERARTAIFGEREGDALKDLAAIEAVAPDYPDVDVLRQRALRKKATRIVAEADERLDQQDYIGAMHGYLAAQQLMPGLEETERGIARVGKEMARKSDRAQREYLAAWRKVPEFRHVEVEWHASNVIHNAPTRADARQLSEQARQQRARQVFEQARQCQDNNQFGAAIVLYRTALGLDPDLPGITEAIAEMERELRASALVEDAQLDIQAGKFDEAKRKLGEAFELSTLSRGAISELMIEGRRAEAESRYQRARDLEVQGKKREALEAFEALARDWPEGLRDEAARVQGLRVDIEGAEREWEAAKAAEAAGELEQAIDHYLAAERFYEKWRDGEAQALRLRAVLDTRRANAERAPAEQPAEQPRSEEQPPSEQPSGEQGSGGEGSGQGTTGEAGSGEGG